MIPTYTHTYIYTYIYIHIHVYTYTHTCIHVCTYTYMYTHVYTLIFAAFFWHCISVPSREDTYIHTYICIYIYIHVHVYTCACIHVCCFFVHLISLPLSIYMYMCTFINIHTYIQIYVYICIYTRTGWRRLIGSPKLQIIFPKRATEYRSLVRKMTYEDKGSYESSPPCIGYLFSNRIFSPLSLFLAYGVATISRLLKIIGLFCRISSLL